MTDTRKNIGNRIKEARKGKMTQQGLADKLGLSRQSVIDMENGKTAPKSDIIGNLAQCLGKTSDWLLFGISPIESFVSLVDSVDKKSRPLLLSQIKDHIKYLEQEKELCGEE